MELSARILNLAIELKCLCDEYDSVEIDEVLAMVKQLNPAEVIVEPEPSDNAKDIIRLVDQMSIPKTRPKTRGPYKKKNTIETLGTIPDKVICKVSQRVQDATAKAMKEGITFSKSYLTLYGCKPGGKDQANARLLGYITPDWRKKRSKKKVEHRINPKTLSARANPEYADRLKRDNEYMAKINQ